MQLETDRAMSTCSTHGQSHVNSVDVDNQHYHILIMEIDSSSPLICNLREHRETCYTM
jgi:hypothetical protein